MDCSWVRHLSAKFALLTPTLLLGAFLTLNCGASSPPPSPSPIPAPVPPPTPTPTPPTPPPPTPTPTPPPSSPSLPFVGGNWSGTLESSSFSTKAISARFIQLADCVDGSWNTVSSQSRWVGAISAFARPGSLNGNMSFEFQVSGRLCSGVGTLIGDATNDTATLTWTIADYNTDTCTSGVPSLMIVKLQRQ